MLPRSAGAALAGAVNAGGRPARRAGRVAIVLLAYLTVSAVWAGPALAGVGLGVTPEFPQDVTVGDTGVAAALKIENAAFGGEANNSATLTDITIVPSCGLPPAAPPDINCTGGEDRGAFRLSAGGTGAPGSACADRTFAIAEIDPTSGRYRLTPDAPVVLSPPGSPTDTCVIDFTFDVARTPAEDAFPDQSGLQTTQVAFSAATFSPSGLTGSGRGTDVTTVAKAVPNVTTQAPPTSTVGQPVSDVATLSGGVTPGGELTFSLFGPDDADCTGAPVFTSARPVDGNGQYTSEAFTPTAPGTYRWVATYSGDDANEAVTTACGEANEITTVAKAVPNLTTQAPPTSTVGQPVSDVATLSGGVTPGGELTFSLFGPDDADCTGAPVFTSARPVDGNGQYTSEAFTPTAPGTYRWVATYSGDDANEAVTTACGEANEITQVAAEAGGPIATAPAAAVRPPQGELPATGWSHTASLAALGWFLLGFGVLVLVGQRRLLARSAASAQATDLR